MYDSWITRISRINNDKKLPENERTPLHQKKWILLLFFNIYLIFY